MGVDVGRIDSPTVLQTQIYLLPTQTCRLIHFVSTGMTMVVGHTCWRVNIFCICNDVSEWLRQSYSTTLLIVQGEGEKQLWT